MDTNTPELWQAVIMYKTRPVEELPVEWGLENFKPQPCKWNYFICAARPRNEIDEDNTVFSEEFIKGVGLEAIDNLVDADIVAYPQPKMPTPKTLQAVAKSLEEKYNPEWFVNLAEDFRKLYSDIRYNAERDYWSLHTFVFCLPCETAAGPLPFALETHYNVIRYKTDALNPNSGGAYYFLRDQMKSKIKHLNAYLRKAFPNHLFGEIKPILSEEERRGYCRCESFNWEMISSVEAKYRIKLAEQGARAASEICLLANYYNNNRY